MLCVDFTNLPECEKIYGGKGGEKVAVEYNNELYMVKLPPLSTNDKNRYYTNSCFSEYIGCMVYKSVGIPVQKVILGTYTTKTGETQNVVACRDFSTQSEELVTFDELTSLSYDSRLEDILATINSQSLVEPAVLAERFWDMFIVDALLANWDRDNGNWGLLYDAARDKSGIAPVFDCGSCLYPSSTDNYMEFLLNNGQELERRVYDIPTSAIKENGSRINFFGFISSLKNEECNRALKRIAGRISIDEINSIIDEMPLATSLQKTFYKTILSERKKRIIDFSYYKLCEREQTVNGLV